MTVTAKCLLEAKYAENAQTTQYTAGGGTRVIVDKCTVTSAAGGTITINLVPSGSAAGAGNVVLSAKTLAANEAYTCPEIVGQVLNTGDFISTLAAASSTVVIRISGREVT